MKAVLGIVGGGQLAKMLVEASQKLNISTIVLDPTAKSPAAKITNQIVGSYKSSRPITRLAQNAEFITFEIDGTNAKILKKLNAEGYSINPSPQSLEIIQDKLAQKQFLLANELLVPQFSAIKSASDVKKVSTYLGYPLLLKARFHGFDGRGNTLIKHEKNIEKALKKLGDQKLMVEKFIPFKKELALQIVRNKKGNIKTYPLVETIQKDGICHIVKYPANVDKSVRIKAYKVARKIVKLLQGAGVFAIEMFETGDGKILVNEIALRVHNSGHWTIEGCVASQFENHVRAVTNRPIKSTSPKTQAAVMINILGNRNGPAHPQGVKKVQNMPGVYLHLYDKLETRIQRKMGHITVLGSKSNQVLKKAFTARSLITI